jgi:amino acid transporter
LEGAIGAAGFSVALAGVVLFPVIWTMSQSMAATELTVRYSGVNGGLPAWCLAQGNGLLARNAAVWEMVVLVSTSAVVSENTALYLRTACDVCGGWWRQFGMGTVIVVTSFFINWVSLDATTLICWLITAHSILCFCVFTSLCGAQADFTRMRPALPAAVQWAPLINILVYNTAGFDSCASVVEFLKNPRRAVPIVVFSVALCSGLISGTVLSFAYVGTSSSPKAWGQGGRGGSR